MALVARLVPVGGSGVVCARQKCLVCARQRLFVCARFFPVILSLYLCNMNLLVDVSSLHHHTTHHCVGFSSQSLCGVFVFRLAFRAPPPPPPPPSFLLSLNCTQVSQVFSHNSQNSSHTTPLISQLTQLISHNSSRTAQLTQLISPNSSHTTQLTQFISHNPTHSTHLTQLSSLNSHSTHLCGDGSCVMCADDADE